MYQIRQIINALPICSEHSIIAKTMYNYGNNYDTQIKGTLVFLTFMETYSERYFNTDYCIERLTLQLQIYQSDVRRAKASLDAL